MVRDVNSWEIAFTGRVAIPGSRSRLSTSPEYVTFTAHADQSRIAGIGAPEEGSKAGDDRPPAPDGLFDYKYHCKQQQQTKKHTAC